MGTDERLKGIGTFVQVVDSGSFARAASLNRQTRSAIAKGIARLEQRLGARLFNRTTRSLSLTEAGEAFYERCRRALREIDEAEAVLDEGRRELAGRLRVSLPLLLGRHVAAPILVRLTRENPRLELELSFNDRYVDLVEEGFDLAVRVGPLRDSATLAARPLGRFDFVLAASPRYLARHPVPRSVEAFAEHEAIVYRGAGAELPWIARDREGAERELPVRRRIRCDDVDAMLDAALAGAGLARLPRWLAAPHVKSGKLKLVWDGRHVHESQVHAVWPQARHLPLKTRAAIDALVQHLPFKRG